MNLPYSYRILAALPNQAPVELHRSKHTFNWKEWRFWVRDMSPEWEVFCEWTTPEKWLVGNRIVIARTKPGKVTLHKTKEERLNGQ